MALGMWITMVAVATLHPPLSYWTVPGGQFSSQMFCALACARNFNCGGIFFDVSQNPTCELVVDASAYGAEMTNHSGQIYRVLQYRDVYKLVEFPLDGLTWVNAERSCLDKGLKLVPHPKSMRERATLSLRSGNFFYIDMQRKANGEYVRWSTQEIIPESDIFEWLPGNPQPQYDDCLGMSESPIVFYDYGCTRTDSPTTLFCVLD